MSNGKIVARNLPGEILQVPIDENDAFQRTNFDKSDNRNFRDGDKRSSRQYSNSFNEDEANESVRNQLNVQLTTKQN